MVCLVNKYKKINKIGKYGYPCIIFMVCNNLKTVTEIEKIIVEKLWRNFTCGYTYMWHRLAFPKHKKKNGFFFWKHCNTVICFLIIFFFHSFFCAAGDLLKLPSIKNFVYRSYTLRYVHFEVIIQKTVHFFYFFFFFLFVFRI